MSKEHVISVSVQICVSWKLLHRSLSMLSFFYFMVNENEFLNTHPRVSVPLFILSFCSSALAKTLREIVNYQAKNESHHKKIYRQVDTGVTHS